MEGKEVDGRVQLSLTIVECTVLSPQSVNNSVNCVVVAACLPAR